MRLKNFKEYIPFIIIIACVALILGLLAHGRSMDNEYKRVVTNNKAFIEQINAYNNNRVVYQMSLDELRYANDSIALRLAEKANELKIKDNQIKELNYLATEIKKTDTVIFSDTIFRDPSVNIDTTIGDRWMNTRVVFRYPNYVKVEPKAVSEKQVILYSARETVNPPKKFFVCRWFQRKHTVIRAEVVEENPYISSESNSFYHIVD